MDLRKSSVHDHDLHVGAPERVDGPGLRLRLAGELDGENTAAVMSALTAALDDPDAVHVEFDIHDLTFLDSTGIRTLLGCRSAAERAGRRFRLVGPSPAVRQVLEITDLLGVFGVLPDRPDRRPGHDPAFSPSRGAEAHRSR